MDKVIFFIFFFPTGVTGRLLVKEKTPEHMIKLTIGQHHLFTEQYVTSWLCYVRENLHMYICWAVCYP